MPELASNAAEEGIDTTEVINTAVETAVKKVEDAKTAAIKAVKDFIANVKRELFKLLMSILLDFVQPLLKMPEGKVSSIVDTMVSISARLVEKGIPTLLRTIKVFVKDLAKKAGEVLGPIWKFVTQLWELLLEGSQSSATSPCGGSKREWSVLSGSFCE